MTGEIEKADADQSAEPDELTTGSAVKAGLADCFAAPGWGVFAAMTGFGAIAGEAGINVGLALLMMAGLWSMPGQIAFVELSTNGIAGWTLVLTVSLANIRMLPVTIATVPLLRQEKGVSPIQFWWAQINSVTGYVQLIDVSSRITSRPARAGYFQGFCLGTLVLGGMGTVIGYGLARTLSNDLVNVLVFITPLYLLLLIGRTSEWSMLAAAALGVIAVPAAYSLSTDWGVVIGGLSAGTVAFVLFEGGIHRAKS